MAPEHVLAREAIQNSVDAGYGAKVDVRFRSSAVSGAKKAAFVEAAGLDQIAARSKELKLAGPNCLATLDKPRAAINLLYVEDYNAEGLSGNPHDKDSNFYRLLLSLGDRSKSRTAQGGTGGSYGFGKSVYSSSSAIQTIFAYTRFADEDGSERTRIFGCGYFVSHDFKKEPFSGRAWLGAPAKKDALGRVVVDPLEQKAADDLATKLGFTLRAKGDRGTSILIVDAAVDIPAITRGVEDWWWPRLIEKQARRHHRGRGRHRALPEAQEERGLEALHRGLRHRAWARRAKARSAEIRAHSKRRAAWPWARVVSWSRRWTRAAIRW